MAAETGTVLLYDKPAGVTSHDVVAKVRRERGAKAGHAGTLDPFATGLLLILLGRATVLGAMRQLLPKDLAAAVVEEVAQVPSAKHDDVAEEVARVVDRWHGGRDAEARGQRDDRGVRLAQVGHLHLPRGRRPRGGALRQVAEDGERAEGDPAGDGAALHRREVLSLVDHDMPVAPGVFQEAGHLVEPGELVDLARHGGISAAEAARALLGDDGPASVKYAAGRRGSQGASASRLRTSSAASGPASAGCTRRTSTAGTAGRVPGTG